MNNLDFVKSERDIFECSECDYKCSSEIGIKEHSELHQFPAERSLSGNDFKTNCTANNSHTKVIKQEIEETSELTDIPEFNNFGNHTFEVKIEKSLYEENSNAEIYHESGQENENIKLEQIDIKHEILPDSPHPINEYDNIHRAQNVIDSNLLISMNAKDSKDESGSLSSQSDFIDSSQNLPLKKKICLQPHSIEIEVDDTGINPPGWNCYVERVQTKKNVETAALLRVGSKFYTYEDLSKRLDKFQELEQVQLWVRDSRTIKAAIKRAKRKSLNPALKYAELTYSCVFGGRRASDQTKSQNQTSAGGCPYKIRLSTSIDGQALVVKEVCLDHNHEPDKKLHDKPKYLTKKSANRTAMSNKVPSSSGAKSTTTKVKSRFEILELYQQQYNQQQQQILAVQLLLQQHQQQQL